MSWLFLDYYVIVFQVIMSTRRGAWVLTRQGTRGIPWDIEMYTRIGGLVDKMLPESLSQAILAAYFWARLDHDMYGLTSTALPKGSVVLGNS